MKSKKQHSVVKPLDPLIPRRDLEATLKEKVSPLLEGTMEKNLGLVVPKLELDITDRLKNTTLQMYIPFHLPFAQAKKVFKAEFLKKELRQHLGNISQMAKFLGVDRRSVHRAVKDLGVDTEEARKQFTPPMQAYEAAIDRTIRHTLEDYKQIFQEEKIESMYKDVPELSRNIAKFLPPSQFTWKEAEREFEKHFLSSALLENEWNIAHTARKVRLRAETLSRKIKKLGLR